MHMLYIYISTACQSFCLTIAEFWFALLTRQMFLFNYKMAP